MGDIFDLKRQFLNSDRMDKDPFYEKLEKKGIYRRPFDLANRAGLLTDITSKFNEGLVWLPSGKAKRVINIDSCKAVKITDFRICDAILVKINHNILSYSIHTDVKLKLEDEYDSMKLTPHYMPLVSVSMNRFYKDKKGVSIFYHVFLVDFMERKNKNLSMTIENTSNYPISVDIFDINSKYDLHRYNLYYDSHSNEFGYFSTF